MATVTVDFDKPVKKIKPLHGVGQPPLWSKPNVPGPYGMIEYLQQAGVPFSRLHDVGGVYGAGRYVDIPNLFRNFDADPYDPSSYDFAFTDRLLAELDKYGVEPFFRLGVTIENDCEVKAYNIYPPKDYKKWAIICEQVIRHYTRGWANGFYYNIRYWEIWNEPDNYDEVMLNQQWRGTKEQFFEFYTVAAKHLKEKFPHLKIGGYGSCGFYALKDSFVPDANSSPRRKYFIEFFEAFLAYIQAQDAPLDFFSWHSYDCIEYVVHYARYARQTLDKFGFTQTETSFNEWNPHISLRGTAKHAAEILGMMLALQNEPVDTAMLYDARVDASPYGALFHPLTYLPMPAYYSLVAFNYLYQCGTQVELQCETQGVYALAATNGKDGVVVIVNPTDQVLPLNVQTNRTLKSCLVLNQHQMLTPAQLQSTLDPDTVLVLEYN